MTTYSEITTGPKKIQQDPKMDTWIWGRPGWLTLEEIERLFLQEWADSPLQRMTEAEIRLWHDIYLLLLYALMWTWPCVYCRQSYRTFTAKIRPELFPIHETGRALWLLHNMVNRKLERKCGLPYEKFLRRMQVWAVICSRETLVDFVLYLCLNYRTVSNDHADDEARLKRLAYWIVVSSLAWFARLVPHWRSLRKPLRRLACHLHSLSSSSSFDEKEDVAVVAFRLLRPTDHDDDGNGGDDDAVSKVERLRRLVSAGSPRQ